MNSVSSKICDISLLKSYFAGMISSVLKNLLHWSAKIMIRWHDFKCPQKFVTLVSQNYALPA